MLLGTLPVLMITKGALGALLNYILVNGMFNGLLLSCLHLTHIISLILLCAWRQDDFASLETVIGNGDNPFAAFALDFETVATQFCDQLAAFTSGFGRLGLLPEPPGASVKFHWIETALGGT